MEQWKNLDYEEIMALLTNTAEDFVEFEELRSKRKKTLDDSEKNIGKLSGECLDEFDRETNGTYRNISYFADKYFQNFFSKRLRAGVNFGDKKYDSMMSSFVSIRRLNNEEFDKLPQDIKSKDIECKLDIVLVNNKSKSISVIEAKNKISADFIQKIAVDKALRFRVCFREYKDYKLYLGAAGFSFDDDAIEEAKKYGIGVIRRVGDSVEVDDKDLKAW